MPDPAVDNVYAPPASDLGERVDPASGHEALRRACIGREASIKGIGSLGLVFAVIYGAILVLALANLAGPGGLVGLAVVGGMFGLSLAIGIGLRRLRPWARQLFTGMVLVGVLLALALAGPLALLVYGVFAGAFLWVLWSRPAATVFSLHYRQVVVPATPGVRYRTPAWLWVVLLALVVAMVAVAAFGPHL